MQLYFPLPFGRNSLKTSWPFLQFHFTIALVHHIVSRNCYVHQQKGKTPTRRIVINFGRKHRRNSFWELNTKKIFIIWAEWTLVRVLFWWYAFTLKNYAQPIDIVEWDWIVQLPRPFQNIFAQKFLKFRNHRAAVDHSIQFENNRSPEW